VSHSLSVLPGFLGFPQSTLLKKTGNLRKSCISTFQTITNSKTVTEIIAYTVPVMSFFHTDFN
jgi:hypothetical protein